MLRAELYIGGRGYTGELAGAHRQPLLLAVVSASCVPCSQALRAWLKVPTDSQPETAVPVLVATTDSLPDLPAGLAGRITGPRRIADIQAFRARSGITGIPTALLRVATLDAKLALARADTRFVAVTFGLASIVALLLAAVGVLAQVRNAVALRAYETAVRSAVGATPRRVVWELLAPLMTKGAAALVTGLALGSLVGRAMGAVLYGMQPTDGFTLTAAALVIGVTVTGACAGPARRAARAGPLGALRRE